MQNQIILAYTTGYYFLKIKNPDKPGSLIERCITSYNYIYNSKFLESGQISRQAFNIGKLFYIGVFCYPNSFMSAAVCNNRHH